MNIDYIANPKENPAKVKENISTTTTVVMNEQQATGNGTQFDSTTLGKVLFIVTGTFVANVTVWGQQDGTSTNKQYPDIINAETGLIVPYITKAGIYTVDNSNNSKKMWLRVSSYTSGSITAYMIDANAMRLKEAKQHQYVIDSKLGTSVAANTSVKIISEVDVSQMAYVFVALTCDSAHSHEVTMQFGHPSSFTYTAPPQTVISSELMRDPETDWIECKGIRCSLFIKNNDSVSHTYDISLQGVS